MLSFEIKSVQSEKFEADGSSIHLHLISDTSLNRRIFFLSKEYAALMLPHSRPDSTDSMVHNQSCVIPITSIPIGFPNAWPHMAEFHKFYFFWNIGAHVRKEQHLLLAMKVGAVVWFGKRTNEHTSSKAEFSLQSEASGRIWKAWWDLLMLPQKSTHSICVSWCIW